MLRDDDMYIMLRDTVVGDPSRLCGLLVFVLVRGAMAPSVGCYSYCVHSPPLAVAI